LKQSLATPEGKDVLELDELCSYVRIKTNKRWLWIALSRATRQVVAFVLGDRSEQTCRRLYKKLPQQYKRFTTVSDLWLAYAKVFPKSSHSMLGKDSGQTNHVERFNNTLRQRLARYVRKSLSFSKKESWHNIVTKLFIFYYNISVAK